MRNAFIAFMALGLLHILSACQMSGQDSAPAAQNRAVVEGPSDGGGGDTCNGKMIESFRVDITALDEYKEFVQPILSKLIPEGDKATTPFMFSPSLKNWYIIECKLQDIPQSRKGLFLESYQTAIHTNREVYIDSVSYAAMPKEEKGKLLLHEMVMGYYLMKYLTMTEICKVTGSCSPQVTDVDKWKIFRPLPYQPLNSEDHQKIRAVTAWLWKQGDSLTLRNFTTMLERNDFDKRFSLTAQNGESEIRNVDPKILVRMLKKYQWTNSFPKFCDFDPETNVSRSTCQVKIDSDIRDLTLDMVTLKQLYVKLTITRDRDNKVITQEFSYPLGDDNDGKIRLYTNPFGSILKATPISFTLGWPGMTTGPLVEGMQSSMLFMMLNFVDPENPEIYQIKNEKLVWYSFEKTTTEIDGKKYDQTYGYTSSIAEESQTLFMENELPFSFQIKFPGKVLLKTEPVKIQDYQPQ